MTQPNGRAPNRRCPKCGQGYEVYKTRTSAAAQTRTQYLRCRDPACRHKPAPVIVHWPYGELFFGRLYQSGTYPFCPAG